MRLKREVKTERRSVWIGIQGGTCAGKSILARKLAKYLGTTETLIVSLDQFYRPVEKGWLNNTPSLNFDDPSTVDWNSIRQAALTLRSGHATEVSIYEGLTKLGNLRLEPRPYIILEGLWTLIDETVIDLLDLKVFIETSADIRLVRRIERDVLRARDCTLDQMLSYYLEHIRPMHLKYVEPGKNLCDLIVSGEQDIDHEAKRVIETLQLKTRG